ncbi:MAG: methyltransferase domain-containing protein, partial [Nocardiopsaceae bacterium]|nr:methyltransferase domain-containing protein [Nocardiopsaceae bacterium]
EDVRQRRASSFGAVAPAYDEHRPDYPEAAVRWALAPVASEDPGSMGNTGSASLEGLPVVDLGAGTGKLTARLASLGAVVTAVEPDEGMLAELRRRQPGVAAVAGSAESIPVPDGSVRAVLCGQSMHWFDLDRALPEIARVLAPGGVLAGLWNNDDAQVGWVVGLHQATGDAVSPDLTVRRSEIARLRLADRPFFAGQDVAEFPNGQPRTADSLLATIATHSKFLVMARPERDRVLERIREYLASRPETADGEFTLPMVTVVLRAVANR